MTWLAVMPENDPYQRLRLKRFLMAVLVYTIAIALKGVYVYEELMEWRAWAGISIAIVVFNSIVFGILRSGRNERLRDPSLTGLQMLAACLLMTASLYFVTDARGALLLLYLVLLLFGVFRLRTWQFTALGIFALGCYAGVIAVLLHTRPETINLREEILQLAALAIMVPCGGYFAGYVDRLRAQLKRQQIELQRARERVHDLSVLDPLTQLTNRRTVLDAVAEEVQRGHRLQQPVSVILVDLDGFKEINRQHGHETGDLVLQRIGAALRDAVRAIDTVGRYGGEEFLVALPDVDAAEAVERAEALCRQVRACRFQELENASHLSASVGVAELRSEDNAWGLIGRARAAADAAHSAGGNRVVQH